MRRRIPPRPRPPLMIERVRWRVGTFHAGRSWLIDGERQPFTLDRVVYITMPRVRFAEGCP